MTDEFQAGEVLPGTPYRVLSLIGKGGMGSVYEVEHQELGKKFVLKALLKELTSRDDLALRLRNEWRSLGQLHHRNIVCVTDAGLSKNGVPYYVMERLHGEHLGVLLRRQGRLPLEQALRIGADILEGLDAAHRKGVVHRDIKPPNIFLVKGGPTKLLDFGIAKILNQRPQNLTGKGVAIGTPRYMSPEQAEGKKIDGRADLYAVGLVLYEMLSGQSPFEEESANDVFLAHLTKKPAPLSVHRPSIPQEVETLVAALLAKSPAARPPSAGVVAEELRALWRERHPSGHQSNLTPPAKVRLTTHENTRAQQASGALAETGASEEVVSQARPQNRMGSEASTKAGGLVPPERSTAIAAFTPRHAGESAADLELRDPFFQDTPARVSEPPSDFEAEPPRRLLLTGVGVAASLIGVLGIATLFFWGRNSNASASADSPNESTVLAAQPRRTQPSVPLAKEPPTKLTQKAAPTPVRRRQAAIPRGKTSRTVGPARLVQTASSPPARASQTSSTPPTRAPRRSTTGPELNHRRMPKSGL